MNIDVRSGVALMIGIAVIWFVVWLLTLIIKNDIGVKIIMGVAGLISAVMILRWLNLM